MAALFPVTASVERKTLEQIELNVVASSEAEALDKAERVLRRFPRPHKVPGVPYCYVTNKEFTDPVIHDLSLTYPGDERA